MFFLQKIGRREKRDRETETGTAETEKDLGTNSEAGRWRDKPLCILSSCRDRGRSRYLLNEEKQREKMNSWEKAKEKRIKGGGGGSRRRRRKRRRRRR